MNIPAFEEDKMMARLHRANLRSECAANWALGRQRIKPTTHVDNPQYSQHARKVLTTLPVKRRSLLTKLLRWLGVRHG